MSERMNELTKSQRKKRDYSGAETGEGRKKNRMSNEVREEALFWAGNEHGQKEEAENRQEKEVEVELAEVVFEAENTAEMNKGGDEEENGNQMETPTRPSSLTAGRQGPKLAKRLDTSSFRKREAEELRTGTNEEEKKKSDGDSIPSIDNVVALTTVTREMTENATVVGLLFNFFRDVTKTTESQNPRLSCDILTGSGNVLEMSSIYRLECYGQDISTLNAFIHGNVVMLSHLKINHETRVISPVSGKLKGALCAKLTADFAGLLVYSGGDDLPALQKELTLNSKKGFMAKVTKVGEVVKMEDRFNPGRIRLMRRIEIRSRDGVKTEMVARDRAVAIFQGVKPNKYYHFEHVVRARNAVTTLKLEILETGRVTCKPFNVKEKTKEAETLEDLKTGEYYAATLIVSSEPMDDDGAAGITFAACDMAFDPTAEAARVIRVCLSGNSKRLEVGDVVRFEACEVTTHVEGNRLILRADTDDVKQTGDALTQELIDSLTNCQLHFI